MTENPLVAVPTSADALEINRQPASAKEALEEEKLRQEIRGIRLKIRGDRSALQLELKRKARNDLVAWIGVIGATVTIIAGAVGVWTESSKYLSQRQREHDRVVNEQMLKLASDLRSEKPKFVDGAALLLSAWEQDAVPLLLYTLMFVQDSGFVFESLRKIAENPKTDRKRLGDDLIRWGQRAWDRGVATSPLTGEPLWAMQNYARALGEIGSCPRPGLLERSWARLFAGAPTPCRFRQVLDEWEKAVKDTPSLKERYGEGLLNLIAEARKNLDS